MPKPIKHRVSPMVYTLTVDQYLAERVQLLRRQYGISRAAAHAAALEATPSPSVVHRDACITAARAGTIVPGNVVVSMAIDDIARLFSVVPGYLDVWLKFQPPDIQARIAAASSQYKGAPFV
jgi:hypothetical protein